MKSLLIAALVALACLSFAQNSPSIQEYAVFVPNNASFTVVNFTSGGAQASAVVSGGEIYAIFTPGLLGAEPLTDSKGIGAALSDYYTSLGMSPGAAGQFEAVHLGIQSLSSKYKPGVEECRVHTGTGTNPCTDYASCQYACQSAAELCQVPAFGVGKDFIYEIWKFENATSALDRAYAGENSTYAAFSANKTLQNMEAYLASLETINRAAGAASQSLLYTTYMYCVSADYSLPQLTNLQLSAQKYYDSALPFFSIPSEAAIIRNRTLEGFNKKPLPAPQIAFNAPATAPAASNSSGNTSIPTTAAAAASRPLLPALPAGILAIGAVLLFFIAVVGIGVYFFMKRRRRGL